MSGADVTGDGYGDVLVGVDGEDAGNGTVLFVPSVGGVPVAARSVYYGVTQLGAPGGSRLGQLLTP